MALSGTFYTNVGSGWRLQLEWSATQSVTNNTSTITARLYWMSLGSSYNVISSATKSGSVTINGASSSFSGAGLANLSGNQKKLIKTYTNTVTHNADGTKSVPISAYFDAKVTLSGVYYNRVSVSGTATLNTIPRKSTMTSSRDWTAGSNRTITISRASSAFRHEAHIAVQNRSGSWIGIKKVDFNTSQTSMSTNFTVAENKKIFEAIGGRASAPVLMNLRTYSGSTYLGYNSYYGNVYIPTTSTVSITNPTGVSAQSGQGSSTVWIDQNIGISITRYNSRFTHRLQFKDGNSGSVIHTINGVGTSTSWTPTADQQTRLYNKIPNSIELDGQIDVTTYYEGVQVGSTYGRNINYRVRNSEPIFSSTQISYEDINAATLAITGNNQYIIQSKSTLRTRVISAATARNGASIAGYRIYVGGATAYQTAIGYNTVGAISASTNTTLTVAAVDSRGLETRVSKTVLVLPYKNPATNFVVDRLGGFEEDTVVKLNGSISPLNVGGVNKNAIVSAQYQYKEQGSSSYTTLADFNVNTSLPNYTAEDVTLILDNQKAWDVRVVVTDKLGTTSVIKGVPVGQPIFFIDADKKSIGVNRFPTTLNAFEVDGVAIVGGFDLRLGTTDQTSRGDTGSSRAMVKQTGGKLYINYANDFSGGTVINSNLQVTGTGEFDAGGGATIKLKASTVDHTYIEYYADSQAQDVRSALIGYGTKGSHDFTINNNMSNGRILLYAPSHVLCKSQDFKPLTLLNGWSFWGSHGVPSFNIDSSGYVTLKGYLKKGTETSNIVAYLPKGYRPNYVVNYGGFYIHTDGKIESLGYVQLEGIRFKVEGAI